MKKKKNRYSLTIFNVLLSLMIIISSSNFLAFANSYRNQPKAENTIYWLKGITAPQMPIDNINNVGNNGIHGEFTEYYAANGYKSWVAPFENGKYGWFDINKIAVDPSGNFAENDRSCFMVSAANLLQWWLFINQENITKYIDTLDDTRLGEKGQKLKQELEYFTNLDGITQTTSAEFTNFTQGNNALYRRLRQTIDYTQGGWTNKVIDIFINGYKPNTAYLGGQISKISAFDKPDARVGYFYPVFNKNLISDFHFLGGYQDLSQDLKYKIQRGYGVNISIQISRTVVHALTVWGAEYDNDNNLIAIYVTDSDDGNNSNNINGHKKGMERRYVYQDQQGKARLSTKLLSDSNQSDGSLITSISCIKGDIALDQVNPSAWDAYFNGVNIKTEKNITFPTATAINYGDMLAASQLIGGDINLGLFTWKNKDEVLEVNNTGKAMVIFTPNQSTEDTYIIKNPEQMVNIKINKATPIIILTSQKKDKELVLNITANKVGKGEVPQGDISIKQIRDNNTELVGTVNLKNGKAIYNYTLGEHGIYQFIAEYQGSDNYNTANSTAITMECKVEETDTATEPEKDSTTKPEEDTTIKPKTDSSAKTEISSSPEADNDSLNIENTHNGDDNTEEKVVNDNNSVIESKNSNSQKSTMIKVDEEQLQIKYPENLIVNNQVFLDTKKSDWYSESIKFMVENNLMHGTGEMKFEPKTSTTRAMLITILHRLEKNEKVSENNLFSDVNKNDWYYLSINWAKEKNIINGYGNNRFGANDQLTREQLVTILYRYAQYKQYDTEKIADLTKYIDINNISEYALKSMQWAVKNGIITGTDNTNLSAQKGATRAELATICKRFIKKFTLNKF